MPEPHPSLAFQSLVRVTCMAAALASRWLRWTLAAIAALLGMFVLLAIDPSGGLLFRIIGLIGMALFALSVVMMLLTFRKARRLSPKALLFAAAISVLCTSFFFLLAGSPLSGGAVVIAAAAGAMIGIGWAMTNLLFVDGELVRARGNLWFLAVWGVSLALPQLAALAGGRTPYALAVMSFLGMGLAVGNSLALLARYRGARRRARAQQSSTGATS
jgi:hypothetical protein